MTNMAGVERSSQLLRDIVKPPAETDAVSTAAAAAPSVFGYLSSSVATGATSTGGVKGVDGKAHPVFVSDSSVCMLQHTTPSDEYRFTELAVAVNGHVIPCLVALTLVTNVLVCAVLLRSHMRTPTNVVLVAMAVSDVLTGVSPLPCFVHVYAREAYRDHLGFAWCQVCPWLIDFLPTIFHTASVWLTVALAVERYVQVCHTLAAKNFCTVRNVVRVGVYTPKSIVI